MQCEKEHQHHDDHHDSPKTEQECLDDFAAAVNSNIAQCPVEWDPITDMCWPPTTGGLKASVQCPDKPGINTLHNACRQCLFNGTWYINHEQDPKEPFTNYNDCFIFEEEEYRLKMEALIGKDTLLMHETLSEPGPIRYWLHGTSLFLTGIGFLIWFSFWLQKKGRSKYIKHKFMVMSYTASILLQGLIVLYSAMGYDKTLLTCYVFRVVHTFIESIFYTIVLFYCLDIALRVSGISFSTMIRRLVYALSLSSIVAITCLEGWIEIDLHPHDFCAFGVYLNPFHWLILWVKLSMNGGSFTLICVSLFGLCYLKMPPTAAREMKLVLKQNISILLVWIIFCCVWQFSPIFVYHMQKLGYSFDDIILGTRVYANVMASSGIVFASVTCIFDIEILALVFPVVKQYLNIDNAPILRVKVIKASKNNFGG